MECVVVVMCLVFVYYMLCMLSRVVWFGVRMWLLGVWWLRCGLWDGGIGG